MKSAVSAVAVLVVATVAAAVVYPRYRAAREQAEKSQRIALALAKDAAFTETLLKMELESTGVTYKELFEFCDKSVDQRNTLIVEMRVETAILTPSTGAAILDFLNAENGFARAKRAFFPAALGLDTAQATAKDNTDELNAATARVKPLLRRGDTEQAEANVAEAEACLRIWPQLTARVRIAS